MKLNYKRTVLVGFAFFLISAFWQAYEATIPVILTNKFGMSQTWSGVIMALDNILAVFMLPLFGAISDKCVKNPMGRRTPFIAVGTVVAAVAFVALSFADAMQLQNISQVSAIDDPAALSVIYETQSDKTLLTPEGEQFVLSDLFTEEEFIQIRSTDGNNNYTNYVSPARQAYAAEKTAESPKALILFISLLLVVLVAMSSFRSPAVALMPDVTIKPLRSRANAVINLMGTAGGILVLLLGMVFATSSTENALMRYTTFYSVVAGIMLIALGIFLAAVKEKKWTQQMLEESVQRHIEEAQPDPYQKRELTAGEKRSLILILLSIALWYFGYNAVTSKYAVYAGNILQKDYNLTLLLAQGAAVVTYLPAGMLAAKIGRKRSILGGVALLTFAFAFASFLRTDSPTWLINLLFMLAGVAWATINVNSFPMVVEMCSEGDVGKYTGYYYTASMAAQIFTPMLSGYLMDQMGMTILFPYAAIFTVLAIVTMAFVRHGDVHVNAKKGLEAFDLDD